MQKFHFGKFNALYNLTLFNNDKNINAIVFHTNLKTGGYIKYTTLKISKNTIFSFKFVLFI